MPEQSVFEGTIVNSQNAKKFDLILIGEKGKFSTEIVPMKTTPEGLLDDFNPDKSIPRVKNEDQEWIVAIRGVVQSRSLVLLTLVHLLRQYYR